MPDGGSDESDSYDSQGLDGGGDETNRLARGGNASAGLVHWGLMKRNFSERC